MRGRQRKMKRSAQQLPDRPTRAELDRPAGERDDVFLEGVEAEDLQDGGVDVLDGGGPSGILGPLGLGRANHLAATQAAAGREKGTGGKMDITDVRREKGVGLQWVQFPPGNWVAPAGSYRGGGGDNETVGAFEKDVSLWRCSEPTGRNASER